MRGMTKVRRRWTLESAIAAVRLEAKCLGRTPGLRDLRASDRICPNDSMLRRMFGSLTMAMRCAGLVPNHNGGPKRRHPYCKRGHRRIPPYLTNRGHCRICAATWRSRKGRGPMWPRNAVQLRAAEIARYWKVA